MNRKSFANIVLVMAAVILAGTVGYFAFAQKSEPIVQQPAPTPTQSQSIVQPTTKTDIELAKEALTSYFSLLNGKQYSEAIEYHGSGYKVLQDWNPNIAISDHVALIKNGCEVNGLQCLKIKSVINQQQVSSGEFKFTVQFANSDGTLFERGPCCGLTEEQMPTTTSLEYVVKKVNNNFLVTTGPVYIP